MELSGQSARASKIACAAALIFSITDYTEETETCRSYSDFFNTRHKDPEVQSGYFRWLEFWKFGD